MTTLFHIQPAHRDSTPDENLTKGQFHLSPFFKDDTAKARRINVLRNRVTIFENPGQKASHAVSISIGKPTILPKMVERLPSIV